jgi:hypothetical protein
MTGDRLQTTRFELKYRVHAQVALQMREFVRGYLVPDEFSAGKPDNSYHNHSIYLDSDDLRLYWDVLNSNKNRYKLRLRYYDDNPASPVFFEIKRRMDNAILKKRCAVRREVVQQLLAGQLPEEKHLFSPSPKSFDAIREFCHLKEDLRASPKTHVTYRREAWVSVADNSARVSFDRDVCSAPNFSGEPTTKIENFVMPFAPDVILELKFTGRFPNWFREMTEMFGTVQVGAAKYADGVDRLGEARLNPAYFPHEEEDFVEKLLERRAARRAGKNDAELK